MVAGSSCAARTAGPSTLLSAKGDAEAIGLQLSEFKEKVYAQFDSKVPEAQAKYPKTKKKPTMKKTPRSSVAALAATTLVAALGDANND